MLEENSCFALDLFRGFSRVLGVIGISSLLHASYLACLFLFHGKAFPGLTGKNPADGRGRSLLTECTYSIRGEYALLTAVQWQIPI